MKIGVSVFLTEQSGDLERATEELRRAMAELERLAAARLRETFDAVMAADESQGRRERLEQLQQRRAPARAHGHGHRDALTFEDSRRRDRASERPVAGRPAAPDP